jgi:hypothetical protein
VSTSSVAIWAFILWAIIFDMPMEVAEIALVVFVDLTLLDHRAIEYHFPLVKYRDCPFQRGLSPGGGGGGVLGRFWQAV